MEPSQDLKTLTASVDRLASGLQHLFSGMKTLQGKVGELQEKIDAQQLQIDALATPQPAQSLDETVYCGCPTIFLS